VDEGAVAEPAAPHASAALLSGVALASLFSGCALVAAAALLAFVRHIAAAVTKGAEA
jgi:hypothetical protein